MAKRLLTSPKIGWLGFDGRIFLTREEHNTYCRRLPVRYAAKNLGNKPIICSICGEPATEKNPIQAAHRVPFGVGIVDFSLTPDWLDGPQNLVWAHKIKCNKEAEITHEKIGEYLKQNFGIKIAQENNHPKTTAVDKKPKERKPLSLYPLDLETALSNALKTGKVPGKTKSDK